MRTRSRRATLARLLALVGLTVATITGCSTDHFIDLNALYAQGEPWELATCAHDTTDQLCAAAMPVCEQALTTDQAHYLKYGSVRDAEAAMSVAGTADVRRTETILIEYTDPTLTADEQAQILESVAAVHDSDG